MCPTGRHAYNYMEDPFPQGRTRSLWKMFMVWFSYFYIFEFLFILFTLSLFISFLYPKWVLKESHPNQTHTANIVRLKVGSNPLN